MATRYAAAATALQSVIKKAGGPVSVEVPVPGTYDPLADVETGTRTGPYPTYAVILSLSAEQVALAGSTLELANTRRALIAPFGVDLLPATRLIFPDETTWVVQSCKTLNPDGGDVLLWDAVVTR